MEKTSSIKKRLLVGAFLAGLVACRSEVKIPEFKNVIETALVRRVDAPKLAPGYGIFTGGLIEAAVDSGNGKHLQVGQSATAYVPPSKQPILCQVVRVLGHVNDETGQSLVWLKPQSASLTEGVFLFVTIQVAVVKNVIAIPLEAVFIKDGATWVIQVNGSEGDEKSLKYEPQKITVDQETADLVYVKEGLKEGEKIVVQGGIGYLYPNFKVAGDE